MFLVLFLIYSADFLWFHARLNVPQAGSATGSIHRTRLLAIPGKGGKTEYQVDALQPEEDIRCVHSLFPHAGQNPCWYVARYANDPIQM